MLLGYSVGHGCLISIGSRICCLLSRTRDGNRVPNFIYLFSGGHCQSVQDDASKLFLALEQMSLLDLPSELHNKVCQHLPYKDLFNVALVCKILSDTATRNLMTDIELETGTDFKRVFDKVSKDENACRVQTLVFLVHSRPMPLDLLTGLK